MPRHRLLAGAVRKRENPLLLGIPSETGLSHELSSWTPCFAYQPYDWFALFEDEDDSYGTESPTPKTTLEVPV